MLNRKFMMGATGLLAGASMLLSACGGGATATPQVIVQTVVKEVAGTPVVETVVITATPDPNAGGGGETTEKAKVLRINMGTYPDVIDPQKSSFVNEIATLKQVYEGLTKFNSKLETVPGSAEKWEYNADLTELTFTLREGLKYSDGSALNAKRFEYAILRNIDPETAGEYASITDEILNAPEWRGVALDDTYNREEWVAKVGVQALDASGAACADYEQADCLTLKLTFSKPAPYFHTIMGIWVAYPAKQENIEEGGDLWWNSSKYQVGNGPFILDTVEPFVQQYFTPNANYWQGAPKVDIQYNYITDSAVAFEAYKNNELDIIPSAAEDLDAINGDPDLKAQHLLYPGACTTVIKYGLAGVYKDASGNEYLSPFTDKKVREAFFYAFDAEGWTKDVDGGLSTATWTWIPPGFPGYDAEANTTPQFDPERAKTALAESSYGGPDALNALNLKLTFGDTARNRQRSEWLVAKYKEILGVDIALDPIETTTFTAITKDPATFPLLARQGWCADYPDPQNWLSVYWQSSTTFASRQGWSTTALETLAASDNAAVAAGATELIAAVQEFDTLVGQADIESDSAKRMELYMQAQRLLLEQYPSAFGVNSANHFLVKPWVKGLALTPQDSDWPGSFDVTAIDIDTALLP